MRGKWQEEAGALVAQEKGPKAPEPRQDHGEGERRGWKGNREWRGGQSGRGEGETSG